MSDLSDRVDALEVLIEQLTNVCITQQISINELIKLPYPEFKPKSQSKLERYLDEFKKVHGDLSSSEDYV